MHNIKTRGGICLSTLDSLVTELLKNRPNEKQVRQWMAHVGLTYSADPDERMKSVLKALDGHATKPGGADAKIL